MQITRQTEYAMQTLLELSRYPFGTVLSARTISKNQNVPEVFLKKTVQLLARAGLVATQRGSQGGVRLAVPAEDITIARALVAIEGQMSLNACLADSHNCPNKQTCSFRPILERAQKAMLAELKKETFADIAAANKEEKTM